MNIQRNAVVAILLVCAAVQSADARPLQHSRRVYRHAPRHPGHGPNGQPASVAPYGVGASRFGGPPLYSTCDRINTDRMLVGTCR